MNLLEEYKRQQIWRNWEQYIRHVPLCYDNHVIDLGCSVGCVSDLLSDRVESVTGIDMSEAFITHCQAKKGSNQSFICEDIEKVDYRSISPINGIWASFSLSYLRSPEEFLVHLTEVLGPDSWAALIDASCFISGNMPLDSKYYDRVKEYEKESWETGIYDFDFGSKLESVLESSSFKVVYTDHDVPDQELNFRGPATSEVLNNWVSRLERMKGLRNRFSGHYDEVCEELLSYIGSPSRSPRGNVRCAVGVKI